MEWVFEQEQCIRPNGHGHGWWNYCGVSREETQVCGDVQCSAADTGINNSSGGKEFQVPGGELGFVVD